MYRLARDKNIDPLALITGNPVAIAYGIIGDGWTQLILREAFFGAKRFSDWGNALPIPRTVLSGRLKCLVKNKILAEVIPDGQKRKEYRLTPMGLDLCGVSIIQGQWERFYAPNNIQKNYAISFYDVRDNVNFDVAVFDKVGGKKIDAFDVRFIPESHLKPQIVPTKRRWKRNNIDTERPLMERSVDILGDYWTFLVFGSVMLGVRRFDELLNATNMAPNILSDRLSRLCDDGVLFKQAYQEKPVRLEYHLTIAGFDLHPWLMALYGWAERWVYGVDDSPLKLVSKKTGERIQPVVCKIKTGEAVDARWTRWRVELSIGSPMASASQSWRPEIPKEYKAMLEQIETP